MPKLGLTFPKSEHLKSKKVMEEVFSSGSSIKKFPFLLKFIRTNFEAGANVQIVISIPKRKVKKATTRNRLRRQIKEAYRLNKEELLSLISKQKQDLALFLIYTGEEKVKYEFLESRIKVILQDLIKQIS